MPKAAQPAASPEPAPAAAPEPVPAGSVPGVRPAHPGDAAGINPPAPTNDASAVIAEALADGRHPERLSALAAPTPFDLAAYRADPRPYLAGVEPGRVFQTAQPGSAVPALKTVGASHRRIRTGATVRLLVSAPPGAPVSWTSFDCGRFADNGVTAITTAADADGIASVTFEATPGTTGDVDILAGSPLASGQLHLVVEIDAAPVAALPANRQP
ncbi:MAG TPA: hypothetical protein VEL07_03230 [Planctomycetota bacterium]|nr:hypothetical protein [Planctomycetota bacterium]